MMTKEQLAKLNHKSLWIPLTEDTNWDAIDFDDMFILCANDMTIRLFNGRADIQWDNPFHPSYLDDMEDIDELDEGEEICGDIFFRYIPDDKGIYRLKVTTSGKERLLDEYAAILPLNFNIYQTFKKWIECDVDKELDCNDRPPLLLLYRNGYMDVIDWNRYPGGFNPDGTPDFYFSEKARTSFFMNNIQYYDTLISYSGEEDTPTDLKYFLNLRKCPLTRMFK